MPVSWFHARMFAARGYHVLVQSVRGTAGSSGTFQPITQEARDGQDTVAWLRGRPWFTGNLATLGGSYLGWSQWALLRDPPPELKAAVVLVGPHDFGQALYGSGTLALADFLGWSASVLAQGRPGGMLKALAAGRRAKQAMNRTPLGPAIETALAGAAPWFADWLAHPDLADPFWRAYDASDSLRQVEVPVLLVGGWQDVFLDQTLHQYSTLRARDVEVAMTIGPWTHLDTVVKAARVTDNEALAWLDHHLAAEPATRNHPIRIHITGASEWRELPTWPPQTTTRVLRLHSDGRLSEGTDVEGACVGFTYDPADPTLRSGAGTCRRVLGSGTIVRWRRGRTWSPSPQIRWSPSWKSSGRRWWSWPWKPTTRTLTCSYGFVTSTRVAAPATSPSATGAWITVRLTRSTPAGCVRPSVRRWASVAGPGIGWGSPAVRPESWHRRAAGHREVVVPHQVLDSLRPLDAGTAVTESACRHLGLGGGTLSPSLMVVRRRR